MLTWITLLTEIVSPIIALLVMSCMGGCNAQMQAADTRFNLLLTVPGINAADTMHEKYKTWFLDNYSEEYNKYFAPYG